MTSLFWPGDHRAEALMSDIALIEAMTAVEQAWLDSLVELGAAPRSIDLTAALTAGGLDPEALAREAEGGGNPVIPLVQRFRAAAGPEVAPWVHRGLTSQDVLDTALVLCARAAVAVVRRHVDVQVRRLLDLAQQHRDDPALARTLTQPALPTTLGLKIAGWLDGVLDADEQLQALAWPVQLGGAAGTLASLVELAGAEGAQALRSDLPARLGLTAAPPWHTRRATLTRLGDALIGSTDAWGRIARDVLELGRPEVGELRDGSAGGSSAMPHKANPTLAVLVRRAAIAAPPLGATLHTAAAEQVDERADGGWHVEWHTLALLLRRTVVAAAQTADLLDGLVVDVERAAGRLADIEQELRAEQRAITDLTGRQPLPSYDGLVGELVDEAIARAHRHLLEDT